MVDFQGQVGDSDEIDVDQLLEQVEAPSPPRAESAPEPEQAAPSPEAPTWNGTEWEFEWSGKKIVPESRDKLMTWASQGYNYSQRKGELEKTYAERMADIEAQKAKYASFDRYQKVDEFARQNPQWWEHVEKNFQERDTYQLDPALKPVLEPILQKQQALESVLSEWQQEKQKQEYERQDQALGAEIDEIRKQFPNIDLTSVDPASGETLELRVLKHAGELGTTSFRAAFRDYFHDKLIEMSKSSALESAAKEKEQMAKKGILGKSPTPVKGIAPAQNLRGKSYDQLTQEALAELGIA